MAQKKFQDLNLFNAFLFAAVLSAPETCRLVLQILLGKPIDSVTVNAEHTMFFSPDCRSIRLDIYADDTNGNHYNVEMQTENEGNLPPAKPLSSSLRWMRRNWNQARILACWSPTM